MQLQPWRPRFPGLWRMPEAIGRPGLPIGRSLPAVSEAGLEKIPSLILFNDCILLDSNPLVYSDPVIWSSPLLLSLGGSLSLDGWLSLVKGAPLEMGQCSSHSRV